MTWQGKEQIAVINQYFQSEGAKYRVMAYWSRNAIAFSLPNPHQPEKLKQASESQSFFCLSDVFYSSTPFSRALLTSPIHSSSCISTRHLAYTTLGKDGDMCLAARVMGLLAPRHQNNLSFGLEVKPTLAFSHKKDSSVFFHGNEVSGLFSSPKSIATQGVQMLAGVDVDDAVESIEKYKECLMGNADSPLRAELLEWLEKEDC